MRRHGDVMDFDFLSGKKQNNTVEQIEDESYIWETLAQKSLVLFPHSPFCELASACFHFGEVTDEVTAYLRSKLIWTFTMQVFDFFLLFAIIVALDNFKSIISYLKGHKKQSSY
jgi:hypothetical protein